jgi:hypothetical protein
LSAWRVDHGDCLPLMAAMPEASVDAIVTDPPYGLGFMGKAWDKLPPGLEWAEACLRVLKPGGYMLAFGGTRTYHRLACAVEDGGFEIRDQLQWLYGSGFPKGKACLKPAHEPIVLARKPAPRMTPLNVDGCRLETVSPGPGTTPATPKGQGRTMDGADVIRPAYDGATGRWPANVVLDEEAAAILDAQTGISTSTGGQASLGAFRNGAIYGKGRDEREVRDPGYGDRGGASRFYYCAKASTTTAPRPAPVSATPDSTTCRSVKPVRRWKAAHGLPKGEPLRLGILRLAPTPTPRSSPSHSCAGSCASSPPKAARS